MRIPKQFPLLNRWWRVETYVKGVDPDEKEGDDPPKGLCMADRATIYLNPAQCANRADLEHTFLHELEHAMFSTLGEDRLNSNEKLVDLLGGLRHQYILNNAGEYDDEYHSDIPF